jgi:hypothetical protein
MMPPSHQPNEPSTNAHSQPMSERMRASLPLQVAAALPIGSRSGGDALAKAASAGDLDVTVGAIAARIAACAIGEAVLLERVVTLPALG